MLTIAVCTLVDRAEHAPTLSVGTVAMMILDIDGDKVVKALTIVVLFRLFEQWGRDASENLMRAVDVERLALNVVVGESDDRFISHTHRGEERFPDMATTFALLQIVERFPRGHHQSSCDRVDYGRWSVFDECISAKNGALLLATVECCALMAWPSREG